MSDTYSTEIIETAHKFTIFNVKDILASTVCMCFYCGYQFNPHTEPHLFWMDEHNPKGKTLACPMCGIDCILGDASGYPIADPAFILACTEEWFGGISRISDGKPVERIIRMPIEVD